MNEVSVGITGPAGSGKSTILSIIQKALLDAGFANVVISDSGNSIDLNTRITTLQSHGTKIWLGTHQTIRTLHGAN
jgi:ABC-type lipoprotein export system ATPase subunit